MKSIVMTLGLSLALTAAGLAGPLQSDQVITEAKWLVHLDLDALRATQIGGYLAREVIDKQVAKLAANLKEYIDFDLDWRKISAVTLYGLDYQPRSESRGVALVYGDLDVQKALESVIEKMQATNPDKGIVKRLQPDPMPLYLVNNEVYVALQPGKPAIVSKHQEDTLQAREVLLGQRPSLRGSQMLSVFPAAPNSFFLLVLAEGFNAKAPIPAQAKVLKMADSLRLMLGESGDQVALDIALKAKTEEVSQQIQQVIQGMTALIALGQVENPDLQQLVQSTKVMVNGKVVSVRLQFPIAKTMKTIEQKTRRKSGGVAAEDEAK